MRDSIVSSLQFLSEMASDLQKVAGKFKTDLDSGEAVQRAAPTPHAQASCGHQASSK